MVRFAAKWLASETDDEDTTSDALQLKAIHYSSDVKHVLTRFAI